jgi:hypothetical protein
MATRKYPSKATSRTRSAHPRKWSAPASARRIARGLGKAGQSALKRAKPELRKAYGRAKVAAVQAGELLRSEIHHLSAPKRHAHAAKPARASGTAAKGLRTKRVARRTGAARKTARGRAGRAA